jgi:hypothetical protein
MIQEVHVKLNPGLPWQKQNSTKQESFRKQIRLEIKKGTSECYIWSVALMALKLGHFGK